MSDESGPVPQAEAGGYYRLSRPVNIFDFRDDR